MQLRCKKKSSDANNGNMTVPDLMNTIVALILRHCVNFQECTLREVYEQMIKSTCNGMPISLLEVTSRRSALRTRQYQKDWKVRLTWKLKQLKIPIFAGKIIHFIRLILID